MNRAFNKLKSLAELPPHLWYSDIREHLFTLMAYGMECEHITEMGVRDVVSTWSFLSAKPKTLVCIDIEDCPVEEALETSKEIGVDMTFIKADTIAEDFEIEETDFLFIDTLHTYAQLKEELKKHGNKARKYLGFHDTTTYGRVDQDGSSSLYHSGLIPAIMEFLEENPHWQICNIYENNNGLTLLRRNNEES